MAFGHTEAVAKKFGVKWEYIVAHYASLIVPQTACPHCGVKIKLKKQFKVWLDDWHGCRECFDALTITPTDIAKFRLQTYDLLSTDDQWMLPPRDGVCTSCEQYRAGTDQSAPWVLLKPTPGPTGIITTMCSSCCYRTAGMPLVSNNALRKSIIDESNKLIVNRLKRDPNRSFAPIAERREQALFDLCRQTLDKVEAFEARLDKIVKEVTANLQRFFEAASDPTQAIQSPRLIFKSEADIARQLPHPDFHVELPASHDQLILKHIEVSHLEAWKLGDPSSWPAELMDEAERLVLRYIECQTVQLVAERFGEDVPEDLQDMFICEAIKNLCPQLVVEGLKNA